jgi:hypothetical protein
MPEKGTFWFPTSQIGWQCTIISITHLPNHTLNHQLHGGLDYLQDMNK